MEIKVKTEYVHN